MGSCQPGWGLGGSWLAQRRGSPAGRVSGSAWTRLAKAEGEGTLAFSRSSQPGIQGPQGEGRVSPSNHRQVYERVLFSRERVYIFHQMFLKASLTAGLIQPPISLMEKLRPRERAPPPAQFHQLS